MHDDTPFLNLLCRFAFFYRLANEKQADNINNVNKLGNDLQDCGSGADFALPARVQDERNAVAGRGHHGKPGNQNFHQHDWCGKHKNHRKYAVNNAVEEIYNKHRNGNQLHGHNQFPDC